MGDNVSGAKEVSVIDYVYVMDNLKGLLTRFEVLGSHNGVVGSATRYDDVSRAEGKGYSLAYREAAAYLRDTMISLTHSDDEEVY